MTNMKQMTFEAIAIKGEVAYASDYDRNGLFKVNVCTGECEFIRLFDDELLNRKRLHCAAVWIDEKIYFIPASANKITIYCPKDNFMESVEIPLPKTKQFAFYKAAYKFIRGVRNNNDIWLVPSTYPGIIKYNVEKKSAKIFHEWIENDEYFFRNGTIVEGNKIIAANGKDNAVLIFDMDKEEAKVVHIGNNNNGMMSICKVGDDYWLAPRLPGAIVAWNPSNNMVIEYDKYPIEFEPGNVVFSFVYGFEDKVIFVPSKSNGGLVCENGSLRLEDVNIREKIGQGTIEYLFETDEERFFRKIESCNRSCYFKISIRDNKVTEYSFLYCDKGERERHMITAMSMRCEIVKETVDLGLKQLINGLV